MIVLGLDTATSSTAVALLGTGTAVLEARDDPPPGAHPGHATRLLEMARALLEQAGIGWSEIERIAVGVGPGTFTGLRVGVASARGLAQSLGAELVGVSSVHALAQGVFASPDADAQRCERVLAVIDARRGEVFAAAYERAGSSPARELAAPAAIAPELLGEVLERAGGPGAEWLAVGDGILRHPRATDAAGIAAPGAHRGLHRVSAAAVCALGLASEPVGVERLLPDYCRRPDAELALEGAGGVR